MTEKQALTYSRHSTKCRRISLIVAFLSMSACIIGLAIALVSAKNATVTTNEEPTRLTITDDADQAPSSASGRYRFAAVASDNKICSQIGTEILARHGGGAVDAAIATLLCLGAVKFQSMGIGGGSFMTIYDSTSRRVDVLDAREVAPLGASEDMYVNNTSASLLGGLAIAVPGEIAGYAEAHTRYGKLPWSLLFQSTIQLCENGFPVTPTLASAINKYVKMKDRIGNISSLSEIVLKNDGTPHKAGDIMRRPLFAATLRKLAEEGPDTFYNGTMADDIVEDIKEKGGIITHDDLRQYRPIWKEPVHVHLKNGNYTLYGPPPPSSAAVLQFILNILDGYSISVDDLSPHTSRVLMTHRTVEAMKFGYGKRSRLGDEDFVNVTQLKALLQCDAYAEETRMKINDTSTLKVEAYDAGFEMVSDAGTSHMSVLSADGSAVAVTSTVNTLFGSKVRGRRTGIVFNNEMDDFSTPGLVNIYGYGPSPSNFIRPGKRPMSSMSPTIVLNRGQVALVAGAAGGSRIISSTLHAIIKNLWLDYDVASSLDAPRFHHQLLPDYIQVESEFPRDLRHGLAKKGHQIKETSYLGVVEVIHNKCSKDMKSFNSSCINAASDIRRSGAPSGY